MAMMWIMLAVVVCAGALGLWWYRSAARSRLPESAPAAPAMPAAAMANSYNPSKVGNDAAARPWENFPCSFNTCSVPSAQENDASAFDEEAFVQQAKRDFLLLQEAWDNANIAHLRSMMTEDMLFEINDRLYEYEQRGPGGQKTEIPMLNAKLLGIDETENQFIASIEFSGATREAGAANLMPFREIWDMSKSKAEPNARWMVAGVESLQHV